MHLCIDMQAMFAADTPWHTPWMTRVLPSVLRIAEHAPAQTTFTRFIPPRTASDLPGAWRRYYERWRDFTRENLDPSLLDLVPPLGSLVPPAGVVDKQRYSAFSAPRLLRILKDRGTDSLIITGAETDVCVLATVLSAIDYGFRVVLPTDAVCSSRDATHDTLVALYRQRFGQQVETTDTDTVLACWVRP